MICVQNVLDTLKVTHHTKKHENLNLKEKTQSTNTSAEMKEIRMMWPVFQISYTILQMVTAAMKLKDACSLEEQLWQT